jgi:hypothetical protein
MKRKTGLDIMWKKRDRAFKGHGNILNKMRKTKMKKEKQIKSKFLVDVNK